MKPRLTGPQPCEGGWMAQINDGTRRTVTIRATRAECQAAIPELLDAHTRLPPLPPMRGPAADVRGEG